MKPKILAVFAAIAAATCVASASVTLNVGYNFDVGAQEMSRVTATIKSVKMGTDVPLAVTGDAAVDVTLEVMAVSDEEIATVRATFGEIDATLLDEPQDAATPNPAELQLNQRGALVGLTSGDASEIDLFASGGVPLQLVVMLAGVVEMPEGPLGVGEAWTVERCQQVPQVGEVSMTVTSQIVEISKETIVVLTDIEASLPDIKTANPIQDGEVTINNGVLTIEGMKRAVDVGTGLIESAEATMEFDGRAAIGPFPPLPLSVTSSFNIAPAEEPNDG